MKRHQRVELDPEDFEHYASFHSNPPDPAGAHAALSVNQFGKDKCVHFYSSAPARQQAAQQNFGQWLIEAILRRGVDP